MSRQPTRYAGLLSKKHAYANTSNSKRYSSKSKRCASSKSKRSVSGRLGLRTNGDRKQHAALRKKTTMTADLRSLLLQCLGLGLCPGSRCPECPHQCIGHLPHISPRHRTGQAPRISLQQSLIQDVIDLLTA
jgi:hypothetical protein